jgi:MoaA/NifB/PqqE/SkfB family radical SAM enzyme
MEPGKIKYLLDEMKARGVSNCTLSGGEPFFHPDIYSILPYAKSIGMNLLVISNGTCVASELCQFLSAEYDVSIQLTFDGYNAESHDKTRGAGNFYKLTTGLRTLCNRGDYSGRVFLRINLHSGNIGQIDRILEMFQREYFDDSNTAAQIDLIFAKLLTSGGVEPGRFNEYLSKDEYLQSNVFRIFEAWNSTHNVKISYDT